MRIGATFSEARQAARQREVAAMASARRVEEEDEPVVAYVADWLMRASRVEAKPCVAPDMPNLQTATRQELYDWYLCQVAVERQDKCNKPAMSREVALMLGASWFRERGDYPRYNELGRQSCLPSTSTIERYWGTLSEYIQALAKSMGFPPPASRKRGRPSSRARAFRSWGDTPKHER